MNWFINTFLLSLETRYESRKIRNPIWITAKQADICKRYMTPSKTVRGSYTFDANGKKYCAQVAPNGCAAFSIIYY